MYPVLIFFDVGGAEITDDEYRNHKEDECEDEGEIADEMEDVIDALQLGNLIGVDHVVGSFFQMIIIQ